MAHGTGWSAKLCPPGSQVIDLGVNIGKSGSVPLEVFRLLKCDLCVVRQRLLLLIQIFG